MEINKWSDNYQQFIQILMAPWRAEGRGREHGGMPPFRPFTTEFVIKLFFIMRARTYLLIIPPPRSLWAMPPLPLSKNPIFDTVWASTKMNYHSLVERHPKRPIDGAWRHNTSRPSQYEQVIESYQVLCISHIGLAIALHSYDSWTTGRKVAWNSSMTAWHSTFNPLIAYNDICSGHANVQHGCSFECRST